MQVYIRLFSNIERENGGAGTYSIVITVMSSCFCHFPTQFVYVIIRFRVQFGINLHESVFQKVEIARAASASAISAF